MKCGFCREEGHQITVCEKPGAEEERRKRKEKKTKNIKENDEKQKYKIQIDAWDLSRPIVRAGKRNQKENNDLPNANKFNLTP